MKIKFVIPVILEDVTDNCLANYDLDWRQLILVDNSANSFCKKYDGRGATIHYHPYNLGVPASWNYGMNSGADFLWIVSSCLIFNSGFSELQEKTKLANEWGLLTEEAWHCIGFTKKTIKKVGLFDEQFYPAYFEDSDYAQRLKLAGIHNDGVHEMPKIKLDTTSQGTALSIKSNVVNIQFQRLLDQYINKWGGGPTEEKYTTPYGRSN